VSGGLRAFSRAGARPHHERANANATEETHAPVHHSHDREGRTGSRVHARFLARPAPRALADRFTSNDLRGSARCAHTSAPGASKPYPCERALPMGRAKARARTHGVVIPAGRNRHRAQDGRAVSRPHEGAIRRERNPAARIAEQSQTGHHPRGRALQGTVRTGRATVAVHHFTSVRSYANARYGFGKGFA
jgi:hypothetical protein